MKLRYPLAAALPGLAVFLLMAPAGDAETTFTVKRMTRRDVPLGKGQCDIRLRIDDEVRVEVRGDQVVIKEVRGAPGRDEGSECNMPLPADPRDFRFEVRDSRDEVLLIDQPSRRNGGRAIVAIRDKKGGAGRYHFRLSWAESGSDHREPGRRRNRR
jgi:hypothetical protein